MSPPAPPAYMPGFGNGFETEAWPGALPQGRNSPQRPPHGLYAEQISGTAFTAPRAENRRSWLYRIRPALAHWPHLRPRAGATWLSRPGDAALTPAAPMRASPLPMAGIGQDFADGMFTIAVAGDLRAMEGVAIHIYRATRDMTARYLLNNDGEMLIVAELGQLRLITALGVIEIGPGEIAVIPRGITFRAELPDGAARGYVCENYGAPFTLPERGPIGANGLANSRDFLTPHAAFEDREEAGLLTVKWNGGLWEGEIARSPLDVVAWHGNYAPYKYDLRRFCPMGPVRFDHADPSIFTVLTAPSARPGTAQADFVIFPDRWLVGEDSFRPPWYHVNVMSEFMGLIHGEYDAKTGGGFAPGGFSLHNAMLPHGPDPESFAAATQAALAPQRLSNTLAFMFETRAIQQLTAQAAALPQWQAAYGQYGQGLARHFPTPP